jgi:hypothetical protein
MSNPRHRRLLALNAALLAALALVTFLPARSAEAQRAQRVRGQYTLAATRIQGITESGVFIIDSSNGEMVAVRWDRSRKTLAPLGFRDLAADAKGAGGAR